MTVKAEGEWVCETCGFSLYLPFHVPSLRVSRVGLYADARFPGRCLLVFQEHRVHLESLSAAELANFWQDAVMVGEAAKRATGAARINYAVLGNATPHLHIHIIPRHPALEELPERPPWNDPRPFQEIGTAEADRVRADILRHLA